VKSGSIQSQLFGDAPSKIERVKKPKFKHSYISECTFLGTFKGRDLYHSILTSGIPMLLERYNNGSFEFNGEEAKKVKDMGKGSYLFEAYERSKQNGLKL
jgi:hypothetical protein